jgi:hypothetical protein
VSCRDLLRHGCSVALLNSSRRFCLSLMVGPFKVRVEMHVISYKREKGSKHARQIDIKCFSNPRHVIQKHQLMLCGIRPQTLRSIAGDCWLIPNYFYASASRALKVDTRSQIEVRVTCQPVTLSNCGRRVPESLLILLTHLEHLAIKLYFSYLQETISIA